MRYYVFCDNSSNFLGLRQIGYCENPNVTRFGPGVRNTYIVHYVIEGEGYFNGNPVRAGQGFLIYPGQKEYYYPSAAKPWRFFWVIAIGEAMGEIFEKFNAEADTGIFSFDDINLLKQSADFVISNNNAITSALRLSEMVLRIINSHITEESSAKNQSCAHTYTDFCIKYIKENIHKKISVSELTDIIGVSQPYLYTIFRNRFNMSIKQYIISEKHNYAKMLLKNTNFTIQEISNSLGYDDMFVFSKSFKQRENISPGKYRKVQEAAK